MDHRRVAATALCLFGFLVLTACQTGSSSSEKVVTTDVEITALDVKQSAFAVDHALTINVTVTSTNEIDYVDVAVGLMQKVAADATEAEKEAALSCALGYVRIEKIEASQPTTGSNEFIVNEDCLPSSGASTLLAQSNGDEEITYNVWAFVDPDEHITETGPGAEDNNAVVFNEAEHNDPNNQKCTSETTGEKGCIHDIVIKPNPGIDLILSQFKLESSLLILHDGTDHPDVAAGDNEYNAPHVKADVAIQLTGVPTKEANGLPGATQLTFSLCPDSGDGTNCSSGDWMPLTIYSNKDEPDGHDEVIPITQLSSGHDRFVSADLFAEGATLTALEDGGIWADFGTFIVRSCINLETATFQALKEAVPNESIDATANNCKFKTVMVAVPESPETPATPAGPSSLSMSRNNSEGWGSSDNFKLSVNFGTSNRLDFQGAHSMSDASVDLSGWVSVTLLDISADANALVSIVDSNMDFKVQGFGVTLFNFSKEIPEFTYDKTWDISKEACGTFSYGIYILSLNVSVCATGTLGFEAGVTIKAIDGAGTGVFANSAKVGSVDPILKPFLDFDGSATADASAGVAKAGVEAEITLLDMGLPLTGFLRWGLDNAAELVIEANIELQATFDYLNGSLIAFADVREVKWCKKWDVPYPCGTHWHREATKTIASWKGDKLDYTLLNRTADTTLIK